MERSTDRIITTQCGSLARPAALLDLMRARHLGEAHDPSAYELAVERAVLDCVRGQVDAGIDVVSDGEQAKLGHATYVGERLSGFEPVPGPASRLSSFAAEAERFPEYYERYFGTSMQGGAVVRPAPLRCTGPIAYRGHDALQRDLRNLKAALAAVGGRDAFVAAVAPSGVGTNEHYATEEAYLFALADALRVEYRAIVEAGFVLQIDDPFLTELCSYAATPVAERLERAELYVAAINRGLEGIPREMVRFHTCYGINQGPRVSDVSLQEIAHLVLRVEAGAYSFENANARHEHEYHLWEDLPLPDGTVLVPGVVTHSSNIVEHPELVAERIVRFAERVGRSNVVAGVDCGFSSQATYAPEVDPKVVWAKLQALSEGARIASARLWRSHGARKAAATREELVGHVDAYLEALAANDAGRLDAAGARFTENGQELPLGKGLWGTATLEPPTRRTLVVADPLTGQAGCFALAHEAGEPVLLALRLRVDGRTITEAETLVCRDRDTIFSLDGFQRPRPLFEQPVAASERSPRELLAGIPNRYLDGILAADGSAIPVADDCIRVENGVQTVLNPDAVGIRAEARDRGTWHLGVAAQVTSGIFGDIEAARDRRVLVVDEELGAVLVWFLFDHAGPLTARGGASRFRTPNSMMAAEVFKVVSGEIREIEAVLDVFPYGMRPGWD